MNLAVQGKPVVLRFGVLEGEELTTHDATTATPTAAVAAFWRMLGAAERDSEHPLGVALAAFATTKPSGAVTSGLGLTDLPSPTDTTAVPGKGLTCTIDGARVVAGSASWVLSQVGQEGGAAEEVVRAEVAAMKARGLTVVGLAVNGSLRGIVGLADHPRPEAAATVAALQARGVEVWMVTGDNPATAAAVGASVGIPSNRVLGGVLPGGKSSIVKRLQAGCSIADVAAAATDTAPSAVAASSAGQPARRRARVAMVGDGVNDSPALAQADVGIAIGGGTDIAVEAAQVVLMRDDLRSVLVALQLSAATMMRVRMNFVWAFVYNLIMMPLAAGVFFPFLQLSVPPAVAGFSELLSSVPVIVFSLLLNRFRPSLPPITGKAAATETASSSTANPLLQSV